jgi:hypothetical protein
MFAHIVDRDPGKTRAFYTEVPPPLNAFVLDRDGHDPEAICHSPEAK